MRRIGLYGVLILFLIGAASAFFALRPAPDPVLPPIIARGVGNERVAIKAGEKFILAFGDSLTAGYGLAANVAFPARLERMLNGERLKVRVQNAGVSGDTSAVARGRLDWVLQGANAKPDLVIIELGGNDMLRGINPALTRENIDAMITTLKDKYIPVLLTGMRASPNLGADYQRRFDPIFPELAKKHGITLYPFFMEGVAAQMDRLQADGIHPNQIGVNVIVSGIMPYVVDALR